MLEKVKSQNLNAFFASSGLYLSPHRLKALLLVGTAEKQTCSSSGYLSGQAPGATAASDVAVQSFPAGPRC